MELPELLINQQLQDQLEILTQKIKWRTMVEGDTYYRLMDAASVHTHIHIYQQTTYTHAKP